MPLGSLHLSSGRTISSLGLGMWYLGQDAGNFYKEVDLLKQALDIGYRVFDTAESYGNGGAEEVLGQAVSDRRREVFITTKIAPENANYEHIIHSCEKSLERLRTNYIDLYLLHWSVKSIFFDEILEAFLDLKKEGLIRDFGVSHFDIVDLRDWMELDGAEQTRLNQTYYNMFYRNVEKELIPYCQKKDIALAAYAPQDINSLAYNHPILKRIASDRGVTTKQVALAWVLSHSNVGVITKSENKECLQETYNTLKIKLTEDEVMALNLAFPLN